MLAFKSSLIGWSLSLNVESITNPSNQNLLQLTQTIQFWTTICRPKQAVRNNALSIRNHRHRTRKSMMTKTVSRRPLQSSLVFNLNATNGMPFASITHSLNTKSDCSLKSKLPFKSNSWLKTCWHSSMKTLWDKPNAGWSFRDMPRKSKLRIKRK